MEIIKIIETTKLKKKSQVRVSICFLNIQKHGLLARDLTLSKSHSACGKGLYQRIRHYIGLGESAVLVIQEAKSGCVAGKNIIKKK
jgi:hypothetical protein